MKLTNIIITSALYLLVTAACVKQSASQTFPDDGEIVFTAKGMQLDTKASVVSSLSSFNVMCVTGTAGTSEVQKWYSSFSGTTNYTGQKYWPMVDEGYKFYASNVAIVCKAGGPELTVDSGTDVVAATCLAPVYMGTNALVFDHILARIGTCRITKPANYGVSNLSVTFTPKVSGTYNMYIGRGKNDGTGWTATQNGSAATLANTLESSANNDLWLIPGTYTVTMKYTLTRGDYTQNFTKTADLLFSAGNVNNIVCTLPDGNAQDIKFTVSLTQWVDKDINVELL